MNFQSKYWTYLIVTLVTVLLWVWAAAETREQEPATFRVRFASASAGNWVINPDEMTLTTTLEGARFAIQEAQARTGPLVLTTGNELPSGVGRHTVDLTTALNKNEALRNTRVTVLSVDPPSEIIEIDALVAVTATVLPDLPPLHLEGEPEVDPAQVTITLPSRLGNLAPEEIAPRAYIAQSRLDTLEPGREYVLSTKLLLPEKLLAEAEKLDAEESVTIEPSVANVTFTVRSFIEETILPTVRVHIAGPSKDHEEYLVEIDEADEVLKDVTISADAVLIERIKTDDAVV
ncbi:MAG: YbbR-like domain-containing protein, partial [Planctomycetota bacterium]